MLDFANWLIDFAKTIFGLLNSLVDLLLVLISLLPTHIENIIIPFVAVIVAMWIYRILK